MDLATLVLAGCGVLMGVGLTLFFKADVEPKQKKGIKTYSSTSPEASNTSVTELNIVAIKLRTQITSTRWFSEMLLYKEYGKLNFAQVEMLGQIKDSCHTACALLDELFDNINTRSPGALPSGLPPASTEIPQNVVPPPKPNE